MMRSQRLANHYLATFLIAAALLHCATSLVSTALLWGDRDHGRLAIRLLLLGILPALLAAFLGFKAWNWQNSGGAKYSSAGLIVLLAAMAISHSGAGAF